MRKVTIYLHNKLGKQKTNFSVDQLSQALEFTDSDETSPEEQKILEGIVIFWKYRYEASNESENGYFCFRNRRIFCSYLS